MKIVEGKTEVVVPESKPLRSSPAFYNPKSALQRDINVALLSALGRKLRIADVMCGTGVRAARLLNEVPECVESLSLNDANPSAVEYAKKNVKASFSVKDGSMFLEESEGFDYIDIDPFGSPNAFLDSACKKLSRKGVLAVTATDTASLTGSAFQAGLRKYWARPLRNEFMHETAVRILIRKLQLVASQYEKVLLPIYCHAASHYIRVYMQAVEGKTKDIFASHQFIHYCFKCSHRVISVSNVPEKCCKTSMTIAGPLWSGELWNVSLAEKIAKNSVKLELSKECMIMTERIANECKIPVVGFYSLNRLSKILKVSAPKLDKIIEKVGGARTHFAYDGVRTEASAEKMRKLLLKTS